MDDPALDILSRQTAERAPGIASELVGALRIGLLDDRHPVQHELLDIPVELGELPGSLRCRTPGGQCRPQQFVEAFFDFVGVEGGR